MFALYRRVLKCWSYFQLCRETNISQHFTKISEDFRRWPKLPQLLGPPSRIHNSMMHPKVRTKGSVIKSKRSSGYSRLTRALLTGLRGLVLFAGLVLCWYCLDKWRRTSLLNFLERDLDSFGDELPKGAGGSNEQEKMFTTIIIQYL